MSTEFVTIISDPHGCYQSFKALLEQLPDEKNRLIIVGDIIDRGPDSYSIFEYVREHSIEMIMGNHEFMFLERKKGM
jgi:serine/threonine protein phosphatase 1